MKTTQLIYVFALVPTLALARSPFIGHLQHYWPHRCGFSQASINRKNRRSIAQIPSPRLWSLGTIPETVLFQGASC